MANPEAGAAKKRKRQAEEEPHDGLELRLAAYGERFMSMFDDHRSEDEQPVSAANGSGKSGRGDSGSSENGAATDDSASEGSDSDDEEKGGQPEPAARKKKVDIVEHIFHSRRGSAGSTRGAGPAGGAGGGPGGSAAAAQASQAAELARLHQERKRFMSAKAAVLAGDGPQQPQAGRRRRSSAGAPSPAAAAAAAAASEGPSREEFLQIHREVQLLGATALDKKARKKFEAEQLARIGAKAAARPRIPASIGVGMAKKQAQRDQRALEEGIAAGMIQQKGLGKKKRRERARGLDRGLNEDGGAFRPGVLRVKPPPAAGGKRR